MAAVTAARSKAAIRLQKTVRRILARNNYARRLRTYYGDGRGKPERRLKFLEGEVVSYVDRIERRVNEGAKNLELLFAECDNAVMTSTILLADARTYQERATRAHTHALNAYGTNDRFSVLNVPNSERPLTPTDCEWQTARKRAALRAETACAICMGQLNEQAKPLLLLSCSHLYHRQCLRALEAFNIAAQHLCPCCRSPYHAVEYLGTTNSSISYVFAAQSKLG